MRRTLPQSPISIDKDRAAGILGAAVNDSREGPVCRAETEHGVLLSMIESADKLISAALLWSGNPTDDDLRDLPQRILDRVHEIEASPSSLQRWLQLLSEATD